MAKCHCWLRGSDARCCQQHPLEACCHWNFGARRVHGDSLKNLYGMMSGRTIIHNQLLSHGNHAHLPTRKPLLTADHRLLHLEWAQRWQNLTMVHWQYVIFGDESTFTRYMAGLEYIVYLVSASSKGTRLIVSKLVVRYTSGERFTKSPLVLPNRNLTG